MKITWTCTRQGYVVAVNGHRYTFTSSQDAWQFIINTRKEVA